MASSTDYKQKYKQAEAAYMQGNYEQAAEIVDRLVNDFPDDPGIRLLRGHICCGLQEYNQAREQYELVLTLTDDDEYVNYANNGLEYVSQCETPPDSDTEPESLEDYEGNATYAVNSPDYAEEQNNWQQEYAAANGSTGADYQSFNLDEVDDLYQPQLDQNFDNPFAQSNDEYDSQNYSEEATAFIDPFASSQSSPSYAAEPQYYGDEQSDESSEEIPEWLSMEQNQNWQNYAQTEELPEESSPFGAESSTDYGVGAYDEELYPPGVDSDFESTFTPAQEPPNFDNSSSQNREMPHSQMGRNGGTSEPSYFRRPVAEDETILLGGEKPYGTGQNLRPSWSSPADRNGYNAQNNFDMNAFDAAFDEDSGTSDDSVYRSSQMGSSDSQMGAGTIGFLEEFDEFDDDLGNIPDFENIQDSGSLAGTASSASGFGTLGGVSKPTTGRIQTDINDTSDRSAFGDDDIFPTTEPPIFIPQPADSRSLEPNVTVEQGWLAFFENAPMARKRWITAGVVGLTSAVAVAAISFGSQQLFKPKNNDALVQLQMTGLAMAGIAGAIGFGTSLVMGGLTEKHIRRATADLQAQFDAVSQGNLNVQATVYSEDELGQLASGFNQMTRIMLTTTSEAQRRAEEQEQAKEDLQRQVIRLLDDVEGAARGDLTVQAEVTADVLGAVADAFNLTIQNLRDIVQQVKIAARQVNKGSSDNERFARELSADALRQAEELAVTLNQVQGMTELIRRVADNAKQAEDVARSASVMAIKGGEAVERTVASILGIRETVAETTRKVKRLAESSQEIAKIVALIAQIASRTNLLALNASIEAARAGEAGRGFAIVADEVRQLADRSAKALKSIEEIVLQIQSETGSVMTAMEEATQQVIEVTKRAEQSKRSLDDIIQVSNRIDALVRSITADTIQQTQTSYNVAQVVQSVELTAQETSQEAQRVSGSLQHLVGVARDLLTSVERFRVETPER
ncbi:methyl-accepting chemotaxis protein [Aerosakkonema funiforme]|uniref:HAMP domain-containing protein n=2 Tax=Oscillatoriophycideae TaxID=1301283 RepID=A0A926ZHV3_9CYAN|nr:methyl-accepting chemotaxis protein [Aerosakkonema funiforme]MBD2182587.1 HAMP domain-containing protein [Aerosakkonema funiforme FACHB-1375]